MGLKEAAAHQASALLASSPWPSPRREAGAPPMHSLAGHAVIPHDAGAIRRQVGKLLGRGIRQCQIVEGAVGVDVGGCRGQAAGLQGGGVRLARAGALRASLRKPASWPRQLGKCRHAIMDGAGGRSAGGGHGGLTGWRRGRGWRGRTGRGWRGRTGRGGRGRTGRGGRGRTGRGGRRLRRSTGRCRAGQGCD